MCRNPSPRHISLVSLMTTIIYFRLECLQKRNLGISSIYFIDFDCNGLLEDWDSFPNTVLLLFFLSHCVDTRGNHHSALNFIRIQLFVLVFITLKDSRQVNFFSLCNQRWSHWLAPSGWSCLKHVMTSLKPYFFQKRLCYDFTVTIRAFKSPTNILCGIKYTEIFVALKSLKLITRYCPSTQRYSLNINYFKSFLF